MGNPMSDGWISHSAQADPAKQVICRPCHPYDEIDVLFANGDEACGRTAHSFVWYKPLNPDREIIAWRKHVNPWVDWNAALFQKGNLPVPGSCRVDVKFSDGVVVKAVPSIDVIWARQAFRSSEVVQYRISSITPDGSSSPIVDTRGSIKPEWNVAPEWACWLAMETTGHWWWFMYRPHFTNGQWIEREGRAISATELGFPAHLDDAARTLEPRPVATPAVAVSPDTVSPWIAPTDEKLKRRMGKTSEELAELLSVCARISIQGIDEVDPSSGKTNRQRLTEEIADVQAQLHLTIDYLDIPLNVLRDRKVKKIANMQRWEMMIGPGYEK